MMNTTKARWAVLFTLCLNFADGLLAQEKGPQAYVLAGSGTNIFITKALTKAFMEKNPDARLHVPESMGSTGGLKAVHKGKIHVALTSRPLRDIEKTWNLSVVPYARTVLAFGVHTSVPDNNLTTDQVLSIFDGRWSEWKDKSPIVVLIREEGDSGAEVLMRHIKGMKEILEKAYRSGVWRIEYKDLDCNRSIERIKGSIGWTDLGSVQMQNHRIKLLNLDGIEATYDNLSSGEYPLYKELNFAYAHPLPEILGKFIAFVKSEEGKEIMRKSGYAPVP